MPYRHARHHALLPALIALVVGSIPCIGAEWTVYEDGSGDFPTIQAAIDGVLSGDTIWVGPGRHIGPLWIEGKNVILRSLEGVDATILQGAVEPYDTGDPVVHFFIEEQAGSAIEGFTIRWGESGIQCTSASPVIRGNVIEDNRGALGGGICAIFDSVPLIEDNVIRQNRVTYNCCFPSRGAGIYADDTSPATIRGNLVIGNEAVGTALGGGISLFLGLVEENTICGNFAEGPAGGVELPGDGVTLLRNIIVGNRSGEFADGIMVQRSTVLLCNDVWSNGEEDYWGAEPGEGDFSADPRFCGFPGTFGVPPTSIEADRYNLRDESPCLPGQHPDGFDCGLIGARPAGCERHDLVAGIEDNPVRNPTMRIAPNPTRGAVRIDLDLGGIRGGTTVQVFDTAGRSIATLHAQSPGRFSWNGRLENGRPAPAGLYFVRTRAAGSSPDFGTILLVR